MKPAWIERELRRIDSGEIPSFFIPLAMQGSITATPGTAFLLLLSTGVELVADRLQQAGSTVQASWRGQVYECQKHCVLAIIEVASCDLEPRCVVNRNAY